MHGHCAALYQLCGVCGRTLGVDAQPSSRGPVHAACGRMIPPAPRREPDPVLTPGLERDLGVLLKLFGGLAAFIVVAVIVGKIATCSSPGTINTTTTTSSFRPPECGFLYAEGFGTGDWRADQMSATGKVCLSSYVMQGASNSVAYYVHGVGDDVVQLHLKANIEDRARAAQTQTVLEGAAGGLALRLCGAKLPAAASAAIKAGRTGKWTVCGHAAILTREEWPTGRGYSLAFDLNL